MNTLQALYSDWEGQLAFDDSPVDAGLLWCIRTFKSSTFDQSGPAGFCGNRWCMCKGKSESSGPIKYPNKQEHASGRDMTHRTKCQKHCFPSSRMKEREWDGDGVIWRSDAIKQWSALHTWQKPEQHDLIVQPQIRKSWDSMENANKKRK